MRIAVIGGGPGGYVAAIKAAKMGADVTVIEKSEVGGTCLNVGCIPTKSLLACSSLLKKTHKASAFGISIDGTVDHDFKAMMKRKNETVKQLTMGVRYLFNMNGVKLIKGTGSLVSQNIVRIEKEDSSVKELEFDKVILATGSVPVIPSFIPYDGVNVITSDELLSIEKLPESLIIVGGGVIGCEFGQFFADLGTKVSIIEMQDHLLPFEDKDVSQVLEQKFKKSNIEILTKRKVVSIEASKDKVEVTLESGEKLTSEKLLVSIGRKPNISNLGLEELGVEVENNKICVNNMMETNIEGLYAIGDIINTPMLAHVASREGIVAVENCFGKSTSESYRAVPRCVYTNPEVASVGFTEDEAKRLGKTIKVGKFPFAGLGKAIVAGDVEGFIKVISDEKDVIIGASIIGPHATDLLNEFTLAVNLELTVEQVGDTIHPHPTLSEGLMEAAHDVHGQSVHKF